MANKNIVVLTRDRTYRKSKVKFMSAIKRKYKKYPKLVKSIENRHLNYNKSLDLIKSLEEKEEVFVIRPKSPVKVSQVEKNKDKLIALYKKANQEMGLENNEKVIALLERIIQILANLSFDFNLYIDGYELNKRLEKIKNKNRFATNGG